MRQRHEFIHGWRSSAVRIGVLSFGWALFACAAAAVIIGLVTGSISVLIAGIALGAASRLASALAPEPLPGPHKHVRRRMASLARISGHELPT